MFQAVRQAWRVVWGRPAFTVSAIAMLALGIGANSAVFGLVNGLLLKPLPGLEHGEIVAVFNKDAVNPDSYRSSSLLELQQIAGDNDVFSKLFAFTFSIVGIGDGDDTRRSVVGVVSDGYFDAFGVAPVLGRTFTAQETSAGANAPVVVLSEALWRRLGADRDVLGRTIRINARPYTVVGVMPPAFTATMAIAGPEAWLPLGVWERVENDFMQEEGARSLTDPRATVLMIGGRLRAGITVDVANARLGQLTTGWQETDPAWKTRSLLAHPFSRFGVSTRPQDDRQIALVSILLIGLAASVLLVACLNLATMLLARNAVRRREMAVRLAIGAGRARLLRQLFLEGLILALLGAAAGLVIAYGAMKALLASLLTISPVAIVFDPSPDWRVLTTTIGVAVASTILFALGPGWKLTRTDLADDLKTQAGDLSRGRRRLWAPMNMLVIAQAALSLALLVTGGLFVRSAVAAGRADPGFAVDGLTIAATDVGMIDYDEVRGRAAFTRVLERLRARPELSSVGLASLVPYGDITLSRRVARAGVDTSSEAARRNANVQEPLYYAVSRDYFRTLGLPVVRGRDFSASEELSPATRGVAVVDESLARALWPDGDALGQRIKTLAREVDGREEELEIVGIVPATSHQLFERQPPGHLYVPLGAAYSSAVYVHARAAGSGERAETAALVALRDEMRGIDRDMPILSLRTFENHLEASLGLWMVRAAARLFIAFGLIALLLAATGIYGVKAWMVARRTREIGIRMALGASDQGVMWMVLGEGMTLTAIGLVFGGALALVLGVSVRGLLYDVAPFDPLTFLLAPLVLTLAAAAASWLPARRAMRVVPTDALRRE